MLETRTLALATAALLSSAVSGQSAIRSKVAWPNYRGPSNNGQAPERAHPPRTWSDTENVRWHTPCAPGNSSPVVDADHRIWLTTATPIDEDPSAERLAVVAYDFKTGDIAHNVPLFDVPNDRSTRHNDNSIASPSPVLAPSGDRVYVSFGAYGTACLDTDSAEILWKRDDIDCDHGVGPGSSPFLYGDKLIIHMDGLDKQFVICLDTDDGKTSWRTKRSMSFGDLNPEKRKACSTPTLVQLDRKRLLVSSGAQALYGYDPETGTEHWRMDAPGFSQASRAVAVGRRVFFPTGFMNSSLLALDLRTVDEGPEVAWSYRKGVPRVCSLLHFNQCIYMVHESGMTTVVDAENGKRLWRKRLGGNFYASPVLADGHVYLFDRHGKTTVLEATRKPTIVAENYLGTAEDQLDEGFFASPAVVDDSLIARTKGTLYRLAAEAPGEH